MDSTAGTALPTPRVNAGKFVETAKTSTTMSATMAILFLVMAAMNTAGLRKATNAWAALTILTTRIPALKYVAMATTKEATPAMMETQLTAMAVTSFVR